MQAPEEREGKGNLPNASDNTTNDEVHTLFKRKVAGVHSPLALLNAMVLFCLVLGRRAREELRSTCFGDLVVEVVDGNQFLSLQTERLSKTRTGGDPRNVRHGVGRLAAIPNEPERCPVNIFLHYGSVRPTVDPNSPRFINPLRSSC